jgi:YfiH family protein
VAAVNQTWPESDGSLRSSLLAAHGFVAGFTTRALGSMGGPQTPAEQQRRHRRALAQRLGFADVTRVHQVHGTRIVEAPAAGEPWPEADGTWTTAGGRLLGIAAADCVPVLVAAPGGPYGAAHAGWRGTSLGIARELVAALVAAGARAEELVASVGPSIGPCCYQIDAARAALVRERLPADAGAVLRDGAMDLWIANVRQLEAARVATIELAALCTRCGGADVWSFRGRAALPDYGSGLGYIGRPAS